LLQVLGSLFPENYPLRTKKKESDCRGTASAANQIEVKAWAAKWVVFLKPPNSPTTDPDPPHHAMSKKKPDRMNGPAF
jgi:hypothetical protein